MSVGLAQEIHYKHFYFSHGDYIRTGVTGQDGATRTTEVLSQGMCIISIDNTILISLTTYLSVNKPPHKFQCQFIAYTTNL